MGESSDSPGDQQSPVFEDLLSDSRYLPDQLYEQKEREQAIRQQVDLLPENQRLSLVLVTYQELSYQEVSQIIGCSVSAVKSLIHRCPSKAETETDRNWDRGEFQCKNPSQIG